MKKQFSLLALLTIIVSCSPKTAEVITIPLTVEHAASMTAEVNSGKILFDSKCHKCHKLKTIDDYSTEEWNVILPKMAKKANLDSADESLIHQYVTWELQN